MKISSIFLGKHYSVDLKKQSEHSGVRPNTNKESQIFERTHLDFSNVFSPLSRLTEVKGDVFCKGGACCCCCSCCLFFLCRIRAAAVGLLITA